MSDSEFLKNEFELLIKNGWLTKDEAGKFLGDEKFLSVCDVTTSPGKENIFNALKKVPLKDIKVLILGKDPYPNPKDAHGLAFSSLNSSTPDSLKNIFKAIDSAFGSNLFATAKNELTVWADVGVLLLNTSLTFKKVTEQEVSDRKEREREQQREQNLHKKIWKPFVNLIIQKILSVKNRKIVMLLWGNDAHDLIFNNIKDKEFQIQRHSRDAVIVPETEIMLLQTSHPSPLSVNRGGDFPSVAPLHFKKCNEYLADDKIPWTFI